MNKPKPPTPDRLMQFAWGCLPTLIIQAALRHRVFDVLDGTARDLAELSQQTGASVRGLRAVANALVGLGLLAKEGERYQLTDESRTFLVQGKPAYHGALFGHVCAQLLPNWMQLEEVVRTGQPATAAEPAEGHAKFFAAFVESLFPLSYPAARKLGEHLAVASATTPVSILDVGAGSGVWGIALAEQSALARVRAVDWPQVLEITRTVAQRFGLADRFSFAPGDLFEADFGTGHQIATVGHILHGLGADASRRLLERIYAALAPGGTIAIMEFLPNDDRTGPPPPLLFAVNMLVHTTAGDTFTFAEIRAWLEETGFVNPRLLEVPAVSPLILATKP